MHNGSGYKKYVLPKRPKPLAQARAFPDRERAGVGVDVVLSVAFVSMTLALPLNYAYCTPTQPAARLAARA